MKKKWIFVFLAVLISVLLGLWQHFYIERPIPLRILIAGPPASGKGTQCELLSKSLQLPIIGTGDLLRSEITTRTEIGRKVEEIMSKGGLVSDEIVLSLILPRMKHFNQISGYILDGFPRTESQAKTLKDLGTNWSLPTHIILLELSDELAISRISGRRLDPQTGKIYHLVNDPPPQNDKELIQRLIIRPDDTEEHMKSRLKIYHENTKKWVQVLTSENIVQLCKIDASKKKDQIQTEIMDCISKIDTGQKALNWLDCGAATKPFC